MQEDRGAAGNLSAYGLIQPERKTLTTETGSSLTEGLSSISAEQWITAGGIILVAALLGWIVRRSLQSVVGGRTDSAFVGKLLGRIAGYIVLLVGISYALRTLGIDLGPIFALAGVAGLALALGLQDLVENLIAGAYLLARRPFRVGDEIETNGVFGAVRDINLRTTVISTPDGSAAYLPNGTVWKNTIINQTDQADRRSSLSVGVAYDSDLDQVEALLEAATRSVGDVRSDPAPFAVVEEFGDSSIDFKVFYWHGSRASEERIIYHQVAKAIKRSFDEAGVNIPFPIRTIIQNPPTNDR